MPLTDIGRGLSPLSMPARNTNLKKKQTMRPRLDTYERLPEGLARYLSQYGPHFSPRLCKWAVGRMVVKDEATGKEKRLEAWTQDEVEDMLKKNGVEIRNAEGSDLAYLANMLKADFYKKSIPDEQHLCLHMKLYCDDVDGDPCRVFDEFYAACIGKGTVIPWERMT